jgi:hypothetical protein
VHWQVTEHAGRRAEARTIAVEIAFGMSNYAPASSRAATLLLRRQTSASLGD